MVENATDDPFWSGDGGVGVVAGRVYRSCRDNVSYLLSRRLGGMTEQRRTKESAGGMQEPRPRISSLTVGRPGTCGLCALVRFLVIRLGPAVGFNRSAGEADDTQKVETQHAASSAACCSAFLLEATTGFEPVNKGFADPRLTTWLRRLETSGAAFAAPGSWQNAEDVRGSRSH